MAKQAKPMDELKGMNAKDRMKTAESLKKDLAHMRVDLKTGKAKQSHKVKALKQQIARIYTLNNSSNDAK